MIEVPIEQTEQTEQTEQEQTEQTETEETEIAEQPQEPAPTEEAPKPKAKAKATAKARSSAAASSARVPEAHPSVRDQRSPAAKAKAKPPRAPRPPTREITEAQDRFEGLSSIEMVAELLARKTTREREDKRTLYRSFLQ